MSLAEILEELPKLTLEERAEISRHIEALDTDAEIELSEDTGLNPHPDRVTMRSRHL